VLAARWSGLLLTEDGDPGLESVDVGAQFHPVRAERLSIRRTFAQQLVLSHQRSIFRQQRAVVGRRFLARHFAFDRWSLACRSGAAASGKPRIADVTSSTREPSRRTPRLLLLRDSVAATAFRARIHRGMDRDELDGPREVVDLKAGAAVQWRAPGMRAPGMVRRRINTLFAEDGVPDLPARVAGTFAPETSRSPHLRDRDSGRVTHRTARRAGHIGPTMLDEGRRSWRGMLRMRPYLTPKNARGCTT
jgi:hypothetical protein